MSEVAKPRPEFRNINALGDLPGYRWPLAALVSGAHRLSGVLMFLLLPLILWLFDKSVSSEISYGQFTAAFSSALSRPCTKPTFRSGRSAVNRSKVSCAVFN